MGIEAQVIYSGQLIRKVIRHPFDEFFAGQLIHPITFKKGLFSVCQSKTPTQAELGSRTMQQDMLIGLSDSHAVTLRKSFVRACNEIAIRNTKEAGGYALRL